MNNILLNIKIEDRKIKLWLIAQYLFMFFIAIYLLTGSYASIHNSDTSYARYAVAKSIVERFDLAIPKGTGVEGADGRDYSWFGIGNALLAVPFYIIGNFVGTPENAISMTNHLIGAATVVVVFLFSIALGYSIRNSLLVSIFYGLGTFAWPLTKQPFDHTVETFFVLFSVYLIYLYTAYKKTPYLLFSAFSLGFAFITRLTSILVLPSLLILVIINFSQQSGFKAALRQITRDTFLFSLVFLPFLCLNCWYNYYRFGSVLETGYSLIAAKTGLAFFSGTPLLTGLSGLLISPGKGYFYYSPISILFFVTFRSFMKKHPGLSFSFIFIIVSYLLFFSKNIYWHGDWAWGPRYLLVLTPFFIIPIGEFLDSDIYIRKQFIKIAVYFMFAVSLTIQIAAISIYFQRYFLHLTYEDKVKFSEVVGRGVQQIKEPPPEIYFKWNYSPIITQFRFIYEITKKLEDYKYSEPPDDAPIDEKLKMIPSYNVPDFWWLNIYFTEGSYSGFIIALILLLIPVYAAVKIWNIAWHDSR